MKTTKKTCYKIRDEKTGLYSTPGYHPVWNDVGHCWATLGSVSAHLKLYCRGQYPGESKKVPEGWNIVKVEMEVKERVSTVGPAADMVKGYKPNQGRIKKR